MNKLVCSISFAAALGLAAVCGCGGSSLWTAPPAGEWAMHPPPSNFGPGYISNPFIGVGSIDDGDEMDEDEDDKIAEISEKIGQFAPTEIAADLSTLPASEKAALDKLIEASKLLDPIFDRQAWAGNPKLGKKLQADTSELGQLNYRYWQIMRGPWDRQDHHHPFAINKARPPGAGFYPVDLTKAQLKSYMKEHPAQADALGGLFTMVQRDGAGLKAVPYSKAFKQWLEPAAAKLREAAALTKNRSLKTFLTSRAAAFSSDDYYQSDKDWMDLTARVEVTIGPYETYEDKLMGAKAAFESFVTVSDPDASRKLAKYKNLLVDMEKNLPIPNEIKTTRGKESPIRVVDLVFASGDARKSVQTIAFNLPNDERVRKEKGAKKVLMRNVIQRKFDVILRPIAARVMVASQQQFLSAEGFFNEVLFHELSHSLGPAHTKVDGKKVEVRIALEELASTIEECKADVMGAYNILYMIKRKELPESFRKELLISYFAGLFRSVRFGVAESHGRGAAVQINRFLEEGAASFDKAAGRFTVDFVKLEQSIEKLTHDLCVMQHNGDKTAAKQLLDKYGVMSAPMKQALDSVTAVPVDLRPIYPAAGEKP